jgi:hypothetical protein
MPVPSNETANVNVISRTPINKPDDSSNGYTCRVYLLERTQYIQHAIANYRCHARISVFDAGHRKCSAMALIC